jgi:hypothetical protein
MNGGTQIRDDPDTRILDPREFLDDAALLGHEHPSIPREPDRRGQCQPLKHHPLHEPGRHPRIRGSSLRDVNRQLRPRPDVRRRIEFILLGRARGGLPAIRVRPAVLRAGHHSSEHNRPDGRLKGSEVAQDALEPSNSRARFRTSCLRHGGRSCAAGEPRILQG